MKDIIKSVRIVESKWIDEEYEVFVELYPAAGQLLFSKVNDALERGDTVSMVSPAPGYSAQVTTFDFGGRSFWVRDFDDAWYVIEEVNAPWRSVVIIMEGDEVVNLKLSFYKEKEGIDKYDYTDYHGIPENAWIEPAKMIREIFS
jgi:hypothetical protein